LQCSASFSTSNSCNVRERRSPVFHETKQFNGFINDITRDESPIVSHTDIYNDADPAPLFLWPKVQEILTGLTGSDDKVFEARRLKPVNEAPKYVFMTDEQLKEAQEEKKRKKRKLLIIPPIMKVREEQKKELSFDPALQGLHKTRIVFTDISMSVKDRDRLIWVRETDGLLRLADPEERHRMNCIYNPMRFRQTTLPEVFHEDSFKSVLANGRYEYLLDRACLQMEPDDPLYQMVNAAVFDHVSAERRFSRLLNTRHYGAMVFHLTWFRKADRLIEHYLSLYDISSAAKVVRLLHLLHLEGATDKEIKSIKKNDPQTEEEYFFLVSSYIEVENPNPALQLSLKLYVEHLANQKEYEARLAEPQGAEIKEEKDQ